MDLLPDQHRRFRALTALAARHTKDLPPAEADGFWELMNAGPGAGDADELDERWCRIQSFLLRRRGPDQLGYLSAVSRYRDERRNDDPAHHLCGNRIFRISVEFTAIDGYRRDLCYCERCGLIADLPAEMPAPYLAGGAGGLLIEGSPWRSAWLTAGVVPVGPSLLPASPPRRVDLSAAVPVPATEPGRRFGVVIVAGGDHIIIQTPLPPFPLTGPAGERPTKREAVAP